MFSLYLGIFLYRSYGNQIAIFHSFVVPPHVLWFNLGCLLGNALCVTPYPRLVLGRTFAYLWLHNTSRHNCASPPAMTLAQGSSTSVSLVSMGIRTPSSAYPRAASRMSSMGNTLTLYFCRTGYRPEA